MRRYLNAADSRNEVRLMIKLGSGDVDFSGAEQMSLAEIEKNQLRSAVLNRSF